MRMRSIRWVVGSLPPHALLYIHIKIRCVYGCTIFMWGSLRLGPPMEYFWLGELIIQGWHPQTHACIHGWHVIHTWPACYTLHVHTHAYVTCMLHTRTQWADHFMFSCDDSNLLYSTGIYMYICLITLLGWAEASPPQVMSESRFFHIIIYLPYVRQLQLYALFKNCFNNLYRQPELRVKRRYLPEELQPKFIREKWGIENRAKKRPWESGKATEEMLQVEQKTFISGWTVSRNSSYDSEA